MPVTGVQDIPTDVEVGASLVVLLFANYGWQMVLTVTTGYHQFVP